MFKFSWLDPTGDQSDRANLLSSLFMSLVLTRKPSTAIQPQCAFLRHPERVHVLVISPQCLFGLSRCQVDSRLVTIDEQLCVTVRATSRSRKFHLSRGPEPDRQQAIVIQCLSALAAELEALG